MARMDPEADTGPLGGDRTEDQWETDRVRDATDPFNAILNYCYTLLEVETRIACEAVGLDPDLGLLHDDGLRESFIYDLLEPLRSKADVWVLELLHKERLHPAMFHELRDGIVRLDPDLAGLLARALMPRFRKATLEIANDYAKQLRRIAVPRRLVREAPKPIAVRRERGTVQGAGIARSHCRAKV